MLRLLLGNWRDAFHKSLKSTRRSLKIISPFVSASGADTLLASVPESAHCKLITRLYDRDFLAGVSDINALLQLCNHGYEIRAQDARLHAKIYIFDSNSAVVTSSNLSGNGIDRNTEVGVLLTHRETVAQLENYFDSHWEKLGQTQSPDSIAQVVNEVAKLRLLQKGIKTEPPGIKDRGKTVPLPSHHRPLKTRRPTAPIDSPRGRKFWVKFLWRRGVDEADLGWKIRPLAPYQGGMSFSKRPNRIETGDVVYHAAICTTDRGPDWKVFGRGIVASRHRPGIDEFPKNLRATYPDPGHYPFLIWLSDIDFINARIGDGISLYRLFDTLGDDTFCWSQKEAAAGRPNRARRTIKTGPYRAAADLTIAASEALDGMLEEAFRRFGKLHYSSGDNIWWNALVQNPKHRFEKIPL